MTIVEIVGHQHLRILALEEELGNLQGENSKLQEKIIKLTPGNEWDCPVGGCTVKGLHQHTFGDPKIAVKEVQEAATLVAPDGTGVADGVNG